jgi:hypothetical protein
MLRVEAEGEETRPAYGTAEFDTKVDSVTVAFTPDTNATAPPADLMRCEEITLLFTNVCEIRDSDVSPCASEASAKRARSEREASAKEGFC